MRQIFPSNTPNKALRSLLKRSKPPAQINKSVYNAHMKYSEFRKWLTRHGAVFKSTSKGSHFRVYLNGNGPSFRIMAPKEIGHGLVQKIKKDLGLK